MRITTAFYQQTTALFEDINASFTNKANNLFGSENDSSYDISSISKISKGLNSSKLTSEHKNQERFRAEESM